jgi:type IV pilus assembly protein PilB
MKIGIVDPENYKAMEAGEFISKKGGLKTAYYLISEISFKNAYNQYKGLNREIKSALEIKNQEDETKEKTKKDEEGLEFEEVIKSAPVAKIVTVIMKHAVEGRASDIHIEPLANETRIRYRIDGILNTSLTLPKHVHNSIVGRIKVLANLKLDETRIPQDGRIRESFAGKEIDFRISILPLLNDEKIVMRILDISRGAPNLEDLGFMGHGLSVIKKNTKKTDGMFLVTGPTGSGKSTTLFSILNRINRDGINISTLEDPVEYFIKGVNQAQVRPEVGFTFASGLRSLLRQDPDIIMVGEIRDSDTAELAVHASLTGHFVLSTLHTNDAIGAIPRLMDMKVEPFLLGSTLSTIVAQRLVRKICEHCRTEIKLKKDALPDFRKSISEVSKEIISSEFGEVDYDNLVIFKGEGCPRCGNTGYYGRVAIAEILDVTHHIKETIINGNAKNLTSKDIKAHQKYITLSEDGILKVLKGLTTYEEVLRVFQE